MPARALVSTGLLPSSRPRHTAFRWPLRPYDGLQKPAATIFPAASRERQPTQRPSAEYSGIGLLFEDSSSAGVEGKEISESPASQRQDRGVLSPE